LLGNRLPFALTKQSATAIPNDENEAHSALITPMGTNGANTKNILLTDILR